MKLKHPDSKQTIEVDEDSVSNYESQGWAEVKPKSKPSDDQKSPE